MFAVSCPHCGAELEIALWSDHASCGHCKSGGPVPPQLAARLQHARHAVIAIDQRSRQLGRVARAAVKSGGGARTIGCLALVMLLPVSCAGACGTAIAYSPAEYVDPFFLFFGWAPALAALILIPVAAARFGGLRRDLLTACAATPPIAGAGVGDCYVCGGALSEASAIARCAYCHSDNIVSPETAQRVGRGTSWSLERAAAEIGQRAELVTRAARRAQVGLVASVPISMFGAALMMFVVFLATRGIEGPVVPIRYLLVDTPDQGRCWASVSRVEKGWRLYSGQGVSERRDEEPDGLVAPKELEGRQVRIVRQSLGGTVERVFGSFFGDANHAVVKPSDGSEPLIVPLQQLCDAAPASAPSTASNQATISK